MNDHVLKRFDDELKKLRYRLVKMGTLVQQQIELAISSLLNNNTEIAKLVLDLEKKINKLDIKINAQCIRIIALHQPVANDLRLVLTGYQINIFLEIIGDMTTNITRDVLKMFYPTDLMELTKIKAMAEQIVDMITKLMDSFVDINLNLALDTLKLVDHVEELYTENFTILTDLMKKDPKYVDPCCYIQDINKNFQLISQQTKGIAQELVYLFDSKVIKHMNIEEILRIDPNMDLSDDNVTE